jgi:hypothetical protein
MKQFARWLPLALTLAAAASCRDHSGPVAGLLTVSLATPTPGGDGAILLNVTGPDALTSVTASAGLRVFAQPLATVTRVAVTGALTNGAILTIGVPNVGKAAQYSATVQGLAASDFQLRTLTGYALTVSQ